MDSRKQETEKWTWQQTINCIVFYCDHFILHKERTKLWGNTLLSSLSPTPPKSADTLHKSLLISHSNEENIPREKHFQLSWKNHSDWASKALTEPAKQKTETLCRLKRIGNTERILMCSIFTSSWQTKKRWILHRALQLVTDNTHALGEHIREEHW